MKKIFVSILMVVFGLSLCAQTDSAIASVKNGNKSHTSITCNFKQEKHIVAIDKVEKMEGMLYYSAPNKMAMHYSIPKNDLFLINVDKLYMANKKRKNTFNLKSNSTMNQLSNLLLNSMAGDVHKIAIETGATIGYVKEGSSYVFTLTRKKKAVKGYRKVVLKYDSRTKLLTWMKLEEFNGNFNTYDLQHHTLKTINQTVYNIPEK